MVADGKGLAKGGVFTQKFIGSTNFEQSLRQILQINDEAFIDELIDLVKNNTLQQITKPIQPHFDLEAIKQKQGYVPINKAEFD